MPFVNDGTVHYSGIKNEKQTVTVKNKGSGAGGANTNANGLPFEDECTKSLDKYYNIIEVRSYGKIIKFDGCEDLFLSLHKAQLPKWEKILGTEYNDIAKAHGTKQPDNCFVNLDKKIIIILEKKFQQVSGSVIEKLHSYPNKIRNLKERFPTYSVHYIYWLAEWFEDEAEAEILDFHRDEIPYFLGTSNDTALEIVKQIISYK